MKYCPNCGSELSGRFCASCGFDSDSATNESAVDQKTEIVNNLYSVKASLSVINGLMKKVQREKERVNAELEKEGDRLGDILRRRGVQTNRLECLKENKEKYSEKKLELAKTDYQKNRTREICLACVPMILILIAAALLVYAISIFFSHNRPSVFEQILASLSPWIIIICIVSIVGMLQSGITFKNVPPTLEKVMALPIDISASYSKMDTKSYYSCGDKLKIIRIGKIANEHYFEEATLLEKIENEMNIQLEKINKIKESSEATIDVILSMAAIIYSVLEKGYREIVTASDWEAIELIIYLFESGRVNTLREALRMVDERRGNNSLNEAIKTANVEVSKTLSDSEDELMPTIELCSNVLIGLINKNAETISFDEEIIGEAMAQLVPESIFDALKSDSMINPVNIKNIVQILEPYKNKVKVKYDVTENEVSNLAILAIKAESDVEY